MRWQVCILVDTSELVKFGMQHNVSITSNVNSHIKNHLLVYWVSDINECLSSSHGCEHRCVNTEGSYYCECNDGFALGSNGRSCSLDCGGSLPLSNGTFKSPGWPQMYPQLDFRCVWTIENIPAGQSVAFVIDKSAFGIHGSSPCFSDYVEFFNRADFTGRSVGRYCSRVPPQPVILTSDGVRIVFQGRVNRNRAPQNVGMRVLYTVLGTQR